MKRDIWFYLILLVTGLLGPYIALKVIQGVAEIVWEVLGMVGNLLDICRILAMRHLRRK